VEVHRSIDGAREEREAESARWAEEGGVGGDEANMWVPQVVVGIEEK
jgi:hypothetical protein